MQRLVALPLAIALVLSACAGSPQAASSPALPDGPPAREEALYEPDPAEPWVGRPSAVERLAAEAAQELGLSAEDGETAVRAAYRYLIETVYFADPVGLDAWRYLTDDDDIPVSYLENRALSPLLFGIGSCEDFAAAMVLLLRAGGFRAEYVAGYTLSVDQVFIDHAWAVVELAGSWYHLDPQLEQNVMKNGMLSYRYYMKGDDDLLVDHRWGESLIALWDMPGQEKQAIRELYTPPACAVSLPPPDPEPVPPPPRANLADVEATIRRLQEESGKGNLPPIRLNVEPPILVAEHHITPPLLAAAASGPAHGRSLLDGEEGALYDQLAELVPELTEPAVLPLSDMEGAAVKRAVDAFSGDFAEYYWVKFDYPMTGNDRKLTLTPSLGADEIHSRQREIDALAADILVAVRTLDPYETALYIHDYLAGRIRYDRGSTTGDSGNLYGALVGRLAYCDGYARAFQYLAVQAGLPCAYLTGKSQRGVDHAWNAVLLEDVWHYVDVTFDRPLRRGDRVYHDYFLISEEELLRERLEGGQGLVPQSGDTVCYYRRAGYAVEGEPDADALAEVFFSQLQEEWDPAEHDDDFSPFFLEAKVLGGSREYERWKELYIKQIFQILRYLEARAREEELPFTVSFDTSVRCDFNDPMQVLTFYPLIKPDSPVGRMEE